MPVAVPPYEPRPDLTTERVRGGRWKGLVVLVAALVVVGGLIWKPWDQPSVAVPTSPLVGAAHPSPSPVEAPAVTVITDDPGLILPVPPTPAGPPTTNGVPATTDEPSSPPDTGGSVGSVSLDAGLEAYVQCVYNASSSPPSLALVVVNPPVVTIGVGTAANKIRAVSWTAVLETNQLSAIFEADWQPIDVSTSRVVALHGRPSVTLKATVFDVKTLSVGTTDVLRVTVLVNWIGAHGKRLFQTSIVAGSYAPADSATDIVPEGCVSVRLRG